MDRSPYGAVTYRYARLRADMSPRRVTHPSCSRESTMFGRRRRPAPPQPVPFLESMLEGPTVRLPPPPAPPGARPRRWPVISVFLAVLALGGAIFATLLGWRALEQARRVIGGPPPSAPPRMVPSADA